MDANQREFENKTLGLRLTLTKSADDITTREMDLFMAAYGRYPQGNSPAEDASKTLRAAIEAGWIQEPALKVADVDALKVKHMRWYAKQINAVFNEANTVPND